ncbi:hypothetical protein HUO09_16830 [Vibrio sp. Y2-5]|uniref:hypothetical protein n=1 Tax=Vibrio sp. Y2-5 TaxID=2743977 RepID=UPI001661638E|nr:hypothetical protein [Vibrio sp. Y2-5]MBD0788020.1 hypothetical protein [Vibrio sp. Y2-5]
MIYVFFSMLREPLRLVVFLIGLVAISTYLTNGDMNEAVGGFIAALKPLKDQIVKALQIVVPAALEMVSEAMKGLS